MQITAEACARYDLHRRARRHILIKQRRDEETLTEMTNTDSEPIDNQRALLASHRRTLAHLLTQQAKFSAGHVPAHVANGIAEARAGVQRVKAALRAAGTSVDDQPDDENPTEAAARRRAFLSLDTLPDVAPLPPGSR